MTSHRFDNPDVDVCSVCHATAEAIEDEFVGRECDLMMKNLAYAQVLPAYASLRFNLMQMANFGTDEWAMLVQQALGGEPLCWGTLGVDMPSPFNPPSAALDELLGWWGAYLDNMVNWIGPMSESEMRSKHPDFRHNFSPRDPKQ